MTRSVSPLVSVRSPEYAILGQTVHLYCNFTLPPGHENFYSLKVNSLILFELNDHTIGYSTSDSASSKQFHHYALLVALVSHLSNIHNWTLLVLLVALVLH